METIKTSLQSKKQNEILDFLGVMVNLLGNV